MTYRWFFVALCVVSVAHGAEPCVSGLKEGQKPGPYIASIAIGPNRGQPMCYICETAERPAMIVFARQMTDPLGKLLNKVDEALKDQPADGMRAWMTILGEEHTLDAVGKWGKEHAVTNIPIGVFDDIDGPPTYRLAREAEVTIVLYVKQKVVANFAFRAGELNTESIAKVMEAVTKLKK